MLLFRHFPYITELVMQPDRHSNWIEFTHQQTAQHTTQWTKHELGTVHQPTKHGNINDINWPSIRSDMIHTCTWLHVNALSPPPPPSVCMHVKVQGFYVCKMTIEMIDKWVTSFRFNEIKIKCFCLIGFLINFIFYRLPRKWRQSGESVRLPS